jgi:hypothetical protein
MVVEICASMETCFTNPYPIYASSPRHMKKQQVSNSSNTNSTSDTSFSSASSTPKKEEAS